MPSLNKEVTSRFPEQLTSLKTRWHQLLLEQLLTLDLCSLCPEQRPEAQHHHRVGPAAPPKSTEQDSLLGTQLVPPDASLGKECNADTCALHLPHILHSLQGASHKGFARQHGSPQNKPAARLHDTSQQSAKVKVSSSTSPDSPFWSHDTRAKVHALTMTPPLSPSGQ